MDNNYIDDSFPPVGTLKPSHEGSQSSFPSMNVNHSDTARLDANAGNWWSSAPSGGGVGEIVPNISGSSQSILRNKFSNRGR